MSERRSDAQLRADEPAGARRPDGGIGTADLSYRELREVLWLSEKLRPREDERSSAEPAVPMPPNEAADARDPEAAEEGTEAADEVPRRELDVSKRAEAGVQRPADRRLQPHVPYGARDVDEFVDGRLVGAFLVEVERVRQGAVDRSAPALGRRGDA